MAGLLKIVTDPVSSGTSGVSDVTQYEYYPNRRGFKVTSGVQIGTNPVTWKGSHSVSDNLFQNCRFYR